MITKFLSNSKNYLKDISAAKSDWLDKILLSLDVDLDYLKEKSLPKQTEILFNNYKIRILSFPGKNSLKVFLEENIVGEFNSPEISYFRKNGEIIYEIKLEMWTFLDHEIDMVQS